MLNTKCESCDEAIRGCNSDPLFCGDKHKPFQLVSSLCISEVGCAITQKERDRKRAKIYREHKKRLKDDN